MNKGDLKALVKFILIMLSGLLTIPITSGLSLILAIPFVFFMVIGILLLTNRLSVVLINSTLNEIKVFKKIGRRAIRLKDKYLRKPTGIQGILLLFNKLFLINFIAVALVTKYLGPSGIPETVGGAIRAFLVSTIISVFFAAIVSPIGIGLYVLDNSPIRILNPSEGLIEKPGWFIRKLYKAIFGYGNLVVLIYILIDSINYAQGQIDLGLGIFLEFIALVYGSISLSALIASVIIVRVKSKIVTDLLTNFTENASKETITPSETSELLQEIMELETYEEGSREVLQEDR